MLRLTAPFALAVASLSAQTPIATITGAGYTPPLPIPAAPGQLVTLYVSGIGFPVSEPAFAPAGPLPTSLGGLFVTLVQTSGSTPVPILQVNAVLSCSGVPHNAPCAQLTAITVQMPFGLQPPYLLCTSPVSPPLFAYLSVSPTCSANPSMLNPTCITQPLSILTP